MNKRVYLCTNGCPRRALDVSKLIDYFKLNNCIIAGKPEDADYLIFLSCSFKKQKEDECSIIIESMKKHKGELIVSGCMPKIAPKKFSKIFKGKSVPIRALHEIDNLFPDFKIKFKDIPDANFQTYQSKASSFSDLLKRFLGKNSRIATLRISYGCPGKCSYCGITKAIGKLKSKPLSLCISEYKKLLNQGYKNFAILADNVGAYGIDVNSSFGELLERLSENDKGLNARWYIQELDPVWAVKYKSEILRAAKEKKIFALLCPVQSGSPRILRLMNRYSNARQILKTLREFKKANPDLILATQILAGFPPETERDFEKTLEFIKKAGFEHVRIYPYYDCSDTPASRMKKKINADMMLKRLKTAAKFLEKEGVKWWCEELGSTHSQLNISKSGFSFGI